MELIIHERLLGLGLCKVPLPLDTPESVPHVPVFMSPDLEDRSRIVVIFGEPVQDLGVLAGRVANGAGGLDKGSMVSVVHELQSQVSAADNLPPAIVIANPGQLCWWPEGERPLTAIGSSAVPLPSLVHSGKRYNGETRVLGHSTPEEHVGSVFNMLKQKMVPPTRIDVISIGQSCELVMRFLDALDNWKYWSAYMSAMVLLGSVYPVEQFSNQGLKNFLEKVCHMQQRSIMY